MTTTRRVLIFLASTALVVLLAPVAQASSFTIGCSYSHSAMDDPIVFPGQPGASHMHDFLGNRTTNAFSTYESLIGQGTTCKDPGDTAAYWAPQLLYNGVAVHPSLTAYYYNKYSGKVQPPPPGLKMVAGDSHATGPQSTNVVYFGCGNGSGISKVNYLPNCTGIGQLQVHVAFQDCWDGVGVERADVAYSAKGACPAGFPVRMPQLVLRLRYAITDASSGVTLASGAYFTMHADFINSWNQSVLAARVASLNA